MRLMILISTARRSLAAWKYFVFIVATLLSALCLCFTSCATYPSAERNKAIEADMNSDAGAGGLLEVTLKVKGEELLFAIDTGTPMTVFDNSLTPLLDSPTQPASVTLWDQKLEGNVHPAPEIYLGPSRLISGPSVVTTDFKRSSIWSDRPIVGILGMDCLRNYSLILDFKKRKINLKEGAVESAAGVEIGLKDLGDGCYVVSGGLDGSTVDSLIDTGYDMDGWLVADLFETWAAKGEWQRNSQEYSGTGFFNGRRWDGILLIGRTSKADEGGRLHTKVNGIGLRFFARHLVTFSFPSKKMYLQQISPTPPKDGKAETVAKSTIKEFRRLYRQGLLPGAGKKDRILGNNLVYRIQSNRSAILEVIYARSPESVHHYKFVRMTDGSSWTLEETWSTDARHRP